MQQREALVFQLVPSDLDGVNIGDLELEAHLRNRSISWPVSGSEAGLGSLIQRPDAEALTAVDVFAVRLPSLPP